MDPDRTEPVSTVRRLVRLDAPGLLRTGATDVRTRWLRLALLTGMVIVVAYLLGGSMDAAQAQVAAQPPGPGLPQDGDLTLADGAGTVLIGLTVRPAQPGPNTVLLYVLPLEGGAVAADVPVLLAINGRAVPLEFCSRSCRTAEVSLAGGEHLDVVAGSPPGGTAGFDLPALPAADGAGLLQQVQDRMHRLRTYRIDETLGPASPPLQTSYTFQAPDRMRFDLATGSQTIFVGPTRYTRADPSSVWQAESIGVSLPVPSFTWDPHGPAEQPVAARIVGAEEIDGVPTQTVAFFQSAGNTPLWFRLSADPDGLVHRAAMHGQGHFMDDHYTDFDAPVAIEPPIP